jgi:hypothetical protein
MRPDANRDEGLRELGVHERLKKIGYMADGRPRGIKERTQLFESYKVELKKRKKTLALELHPDVNLEEPEEVRVARTEKLKRVLSAIEFVMALQVRPPPRPRQVFWVIQGIRTGNPFSGTQTSTGTMTGAWNTIIR